MNAAIVVSCEWLGGERWLTLEELAVAAGASPSFVRALWEEGLIEAGLVEAGAPRFEGMALERVRRMRRLMRDFEASFTAAAMMMELIDEIARLRRLLDRAGISWRDEP
ncbi:chaperone modulator CbpM [Tepidiphilus margaritifer]|uniref:chaperone modulator CbpM n=1 Tax=Tepidiphilus margaritifer TaxID=203471 RepID=UPI00041B9888|nr:chaperone modulator CbpM [Tepidiphilus margaritifer]